MVLLSFALLQCGGISGSAGDSVSGGTVAQPELNPVPADTVHVAMSGSQTMDTGGSVPGKDVTPFFLSLKTVKGCIVPGTDKINVAITAAVEENDRVLRIVNTLGQFVETKTAKGTVDLSKIDPEILDGMFNFEIPLEKGHVPQIYLMKQDYTPGNLDTLMPPSDDATWLDSVEFKYQVPVPTYAHLLGFNLPNCALVEILSKPMLPLDIHTNK